MSQPTSSRARAHDIVRLSVPGALLCVTLFAATLPFVPWLAGYWLGSAIQGAVFFYAIYQHLAHPRPWAFAVFLALVLLGARLTLDVFLPSPGVRPFGWLLLMQFVAVFWLVVFLLVRAFRGRILAKVQAQSDAA